MYTLHCTLYALGSSNNMRAAKDEKWDAKWSNEAGRARGRLLCQGRVMLSMAEKLDPRQEHDCNMHKMVFTWTREEKAEAKSDGSAPSRHDWIHVGNLDFILPF